MRRRATAEAMALPRGGRMERREIVKGSAAFPPRRSLLYTSNEWYALPVITDVALLGR